MNRALFFAVCAAAFLLSSCYHNAELAQRAADGDPQAQYEYARRLLTGQKGLTAEPECAVAWLHPAAEAGYAPAQALLALCYERGLGTERSPREANRLYTAAAEQGHAPACRALVAQEMAAGRLPAAERWLRLLAEQDNAGAQLVYAKMCLGGSFGHRREAEALRYLRFAAMQGNAEACLLMADCYAEGIGVPRNAALAQGWRRNAEED